jgi:putative intracellular protease/amidase
MSDSSERKVIMNHTQKIGVLIESGFDVNEVSKINWFFPAHGYQVEYLSDLWGHPSIVFHGNDFSHDLTVRTDIRQVKPEDYSGLILIGGYAMDRLRYQEHVTHHQINQAPAVQFLRQAVKAMDQKHLVIGAIDHSLWLFCAAPELLRGRLVTCCHNILCDVVNAGAQVFYEGQHLKDVMVDGALVTARHSGLANRFLETFLETLQWQREHHWHEPTQGEVDTYLDSLARLHANRR